MRKLDGANLEDDLWPPRPPKSFWVIERPWLDRSGREGVCRYPLDDPDEIPPPVKNESHNCCCGMKDFRIIDKVGTNLFEILGLYPLKLNHSRMSQS